MRLKADDEIVLLVEPGDPGPGNPIQKRKTERNTTKPEKGM